MVSQLTHEILSNLPHVVALALALGVMIGATGSTVEAVGLFAQRFANAKVQAFGVSLVHFGKLLEAYGTDIPKIVTNATGWVTQFAKLFGTASLALILACSCVGVVACASAGPTAKKAVADAEKICADLPRLRALERLAESEASDSGAQGAAGAP